MFKVKISNFIQNNKHKIQDLSIKLIMVALIVFMGTIILSLSTGDSNTQNNEKETQLYKPKETIIKGTEVPEEQYESDTNLVNNFLDYCNGKKVEEAYNLLSDGCKDNLYPSLETFKNTYYNIVFSEQRDYNLQAWISTTEYTVYKIRYTTNMLAMGIYDENNVYQDYITLIKNLDSNKVSIGTYIETETLGTKTITDEIEATIIKKDIYLENEKYEIQIKNKTNNTIMLDTLQTSQTIKLIGNGNGAYTPFINKIFQSDMIIEPGDTHIVSITFNKPCSSQNESDYIQLYRVIRNYDEYIKDESNYNDTFNVKIDI